MNYDDFKETAVEMLKTYLPEKYRNQKIEIDTVNKINRNNMDGLRLVSESDKLGAVPTIYINDMYEHYQTTNDLEVVLKTAASKLEVALENNIVTREILDFANVKNNIVFQMINTEQNKELLTDTPNRPFQDLSIIYRWIVKNDEEGIHSTVINNKLLEKIGITEEQMFKLAVENTRRIFPPVIKSMREILMEMFMQDDMPGEITYLLMNEETFPRKNMWVITNNKKINGAVSMLYENEIHLLAEEIGSDLYILPSSIHEIIAISAELGDSNELAQMVAEINMEQVDLEERLSNQVYRYDKDLRKYFLVTDTPNKIKNMEDADTFNKKSR